MPRLFGTDGVRGIANDGLSPELAYGLARAGAHVLAHRGGSGSETGSDTRPFVLLGKDPRASGDLLEAAAAAGVMSAGVDVAVLGVVTTPAVAFLTRHLGALGGIMISASHNPAEYNGIKFFTADGLKASEETENEIEALMGQQGNLPRPTGGQVGRRRESSGSVQAYLDHLTATVGTAKTDFSRYKVVLDCANGAASELGPALLSRLGARVVSINDRPDGLNINAGCGSLHLEPLGAAVLRERADLGLALDGDADRVLAVDERGNVVDGDAILALAATHLAARDRLPGKVIVATVMSNLGLDRALERQDIRVVRSPVGDRQVLEAMVREGATLGGEQSGHIIFLDHATTGDGLLTALRVLHIMLETGRPLSELSGVLETFPQVLLNVPVQEKETFATNTAVRDVIEQAARTLGKNGRLVVRPSGTEPLIRILGEGRDREQVEELVQTIADVIWRELVVG